MSLASCGSGSLLLGDELLPPLSARSNADTSFSQMAATNSCEMCSNYEQQLQQLQVPRAHEHCAIA